MNLGRTIPAGIFLILFISGCRKKDEYTRPVTVDLKIGVSMDSSLTADFLHVTSVRIGIGGISFRGMRNPGGVYYFETDPKMDFQKFSSSWITESVQVSDFDMPQGIYQGMYWDIFLTPLSPDYFLSDGLTENELKDIGCVDPGDGYWSGGPTVSVSGIYKSVNGDKLPFVCALSPSVNLNVLSVDEFGNEWITLFVDKDYEAVMTFRFRTNNRVLKQDLFENAEISTGSGYPRIIISALRNWDLCCELGLDMSVNVIIRKL
jgi:hypothetical protein